MRFDLMQFDQIYEISYVGDLQRPSMNLSKEIPKTSLYSW